MDDNSAQSSSPQQNNSVQGSSNQEMSVGQTEQDPQVNNPTVETTSSPENVEQSPSVYNNPEPKMDSPSASPPPVQNIVDQQAIIGPHSNSNGGNGFKIFVIIGIVIILAVWGGVGYLYLKNKNAKNESSSDYQTQEEIVEATPTPEFTPDQIKIKNGSVVRERPGGETNVLVDKKEYPSTGITGFLKVNVSPDEAHLCFESWSPAPDPALYISDVSGQNVVEVSANRQNCLWSNDSKNIYYTNTSTKTSPVNIFSYNLENALETDLTSVSVPSGVVRRFEIVGLSADGSKIICKYENLGGAAATETMSECEVNLETGTVNSI